MLANNQVNLVASDHLMPGISGAELAREIRATTSELPVMIVSGYAEVDGIAADLPRLAKPFRRSELADKLKELSGNLSATLARNTVRAVSDARI